MDPLYQESRMVLPRNLTILFAIVMVATWASMLVAKMFFYQGMSMDAIVIAGVVFAIVIVLTFLMKFTITIYDDRLEVFYIIRKVVIPKDEILDYKTGEISLIKNYSEWNIRGVKYSTYSAIGEDLGIGMKIKDMRVMYLSTKDPEALTSFLPKE